jgi:(S)-sulfolactate dehydrogenase
LLTAALTFLRWTGWSGTASLLKGEWPRETAGAGREGGGKTLGLIGFGSIGQVTAAKARALGFQIVASDEFLLANDPAWQSAERVDLQTLLARSDIVSLHCPSTPGTRGLIGAAQIAAMKPGAVLINTARGGIVDDAALAAALRSGHLGGAAVDVFDPEPIAAGIAALYAGLTNIVLTPHIAGVTAESNVRISAITADNVLRTLQERGL